LKIQTPEIIRFTFSVVFFLLGDSTQWPTKGRFWGQTPPLGTPLGKYVNHKSQEYETLNFARAVCVFVLFA
jgi:hypothetical protein